MAKRSYANVCSIRVPVSGVTSYGGGHIFPGAKDIGSYAKVSKATAKKLAADLGVRLPRMGYEITLCKDTFLSNKSGRFEVERRTSGGFQGRSGCSVSIGKKKAPKTLKRRRR